VFLSYASQDVEAARRICEALRSAGIEVWLDQSELRGGDAWDRQIRKQIHDCALFIPLISQHSQERLEGYFRLEWKLAVDRSHRMAAERSFIVPVVVDSTRERGALVPDSFRDVQWTHLPGGVASTAFVARVEALLGAEAPVVSTGSSPTPVTSRPAATRDRWVFWTPLGLAALAIVVGGSLFVLQHFGLHRRAETDVPPQAKPAVTEKSIAVLPFVDLSEKHDQEYFADGIAEETLNQLAKIRGLKVIGRTSSFQFKGRADDLRKIGTTLGAAYVLEGSVRRSGDRIRVTAQLIDTRDGAHRWSETYERSASDVLMVQDEISVGLARALQLEVDSGSRKAPKSPEAYDSYLRGLHARERYDQGGFEEAVADFRQTLQLDPDFVPAAEGLARALLDQAEWSFVPPRVGFEQSRAAVMAALRLDPKSALAHALLASIHTWYDWDWSSAERESRAAVALAPNDPTVLMFAAQGRMAVGQWADAARGISEALAVDPLHAAAYETAAWNYLRLGRVAEAESAGRRMLEIIPTYSGGYHNLGTVLLLQGKADAALDEMARESNLGWRAAGMAAAYQALHRLPEADTELAKLELEHSGDMAMEIAEVYAIRAQQNLAFSWLDRAYAQKDIFLWLIKGDPLLKNLDGDARYKAFLRKMNLPD
jgi:TolB-like protein/tetratricopeptide (TPR) repeat protein